MSKLVKLDREQLEQLNQESLIELILALQAQLAAQQVLIQELQDQLAKDSNNSSKPPSSDGLKKRRRQSLRQSGQRPRGGQPGHKGRTLTPVAEPHHVILHTLQDCPHCQTELKAVGAKGHVKRQVFDMPPVGIKVTPVGLSLGGQDPVNFRHDYQTEVCRIPSEHADQLHLYQSG